jgi:hypothetical protein
MNRLLARNFVMLAVASLLFCFCSTAQTTAPMIVTGVLDGSNNGASPSEQYKSIAMGPDGFSRFLLDAFDPDTYIREIILVRCLDADCTNKNVNMVASGSILPSAGGSLAIGSDGYPRIVYLGEGVVIHFIQCLNADCTSSVQTTPFMSPDDDCNTGWPDYTPISGVYCSEGYSVQLIMGSNGLPQILFDWQDSWYQSYTLSLATCSDASCSSISVVDIAQMDPADSGGAAAIVPGQDGKPRIVYTDDQYDYNTGYDDLPWPTYFVQCTTETCSGKSVQNIGDAGLGGMDVAVGPDGFGRIVFGDTYSTQIYVLQCTDDDCSTRDQTGIPMQWVPWPLQVGVDGDGNMGIGMDYEGVLQYIHCTNASCSSYNIEQILPPYSAYGSMAIGPDGLLRMVAVDYGSDYSEVMIDHIRRHVTVNITGSHGIPLGHSGGFEVEIGPNLGGTPIALSISTDTGTGDATFINGTHTITLDGSATVPVNGVTVSSTADNMILKALDSNNHLLASVSFTVVWVTLSIRSGVGLTPSQDNSAGGAGGPYDSTYGTRSLGPFASNIRGACFTGAEFIGTVSPTNYTGLVVLRRKKLSYGAWTGSDLYGEVTQPSDDTSNLAVRDDDPHSGGSNGVVYDLDAPGIEASSVNVTWRSRQNLSEYAVLDSQNNDTPVSDTMNWFSAVSCTTPDFSNYTLSTGVLGDNVAGEGIVNLDCCTLH